MVQKMRTNSRRYYPKGRNSDAMRQLPKDTNLIYGACTFKSSLHPRDDTAAAQINQNNASSQSIQKIYCTIKMIASSRHSLLKAAKQLATTRQYSATTTLNDRIVIAVGGNALQRRGERLTIENMLKAAADMAPTLAALSKDHELVLTHGNGPQVGELALERSAATFDVLGAESMGQIGYVLAQALSSAGRTTAPIICQVVVDPQHEAFRDPSKFVGPIYGAKEATALSQSLGWVMKPDGEYFRRVVPSPPPKE